MISVDRRPNPFGLLSLVLSALAAPSCVSKDYQVLPSTGGTNPSGLVGAGSYDGGAPDDTLATSDGQDVAVAAADSDANSGICDLLTQQGCPQSQGCYPVAGVGRCQDPGPNFANTPCDPSLGPEGQCIVGFACVATAALGVVCETLCNVLNPPKGCLPSCQPLPGFTTVGYCPP
jgi:hypothetical protein